MKLIESTFATVRHHTRRAKNCLSRSTFLGLAYKLMEETVKSWHRIPDPLYGVVFEDGIPVTDDPPEQHMLAA